MDLVLLAALVVGRDLVTADQEPQRVSRIRQLDPEVRGLQPVDVHRQLRFADVERGVDVHQPRLLARRFGDGRAVIGGRGCGTPSGTGTDRFDGSGLTGPTIPDDLRMLILGSLVMALGFVVYFAYGKRHSMVGRRSAETSEVSAER
mgnify:CR=1 FL=1